MASNDNSDQAMTLAARMYICLVIVVGLVIFLSGLAHWDSDNVTRCVVYLVVTVLASGLKVSLPSVTGTMSVYFLFLLVGVIELKRPEVLLMAVSATLVQCFWQAKKRPTLVQTLFNVGSSTLAIALTYGTYHSRWLEALELGAPMRLAASAVAFFVTNTGFVAMVIALTEGKSPRRVWQECYFWCFPYYLVGASIAGGVSVLGRWAGWQTALLVLPVIYVIYRSYRLYLGRLEDEKAHAEQMAALHLRTIEALALAIDAKDHTTHEHLRRVQVYALEIGKELGLAESELAALQAAALLHDIGKLAVPEHIISKPGKLTPEEFEKMKIHPVVGAEILSRVQFPYPVVPIVRSHHERWNGTGYPDGLKGEEIPIGARILSAVDCLDALASDRQYRRALPLDEAINVVLADSGQAFDPRVVEILGRRYRELEEMSRTGHGGLERNRLPRDVRVERGTAPAAGFENSGPHPASASGQTDDFLLSIAAARQEAQALYELAQTLGNSLSLNETMSVMAARLKRLVPFDGMAIYVLRDRVLKPAYVTGEDAKLFGSLEIPIGQGLSGWVADTRKPMVNGNPSVEPGYLNDPTRFSTLNSALAVPLEGANGVVGVMALYSARQDAYSRDQLRVMLAIGSKLTMAVENSLKFEEAESSAVTDFLTGLPNARSLFVHLDGEIARCQRDGKGLAVLVTDLDGFKQVNDRFGHLAGNRVLSQVANGLRGRCREYDYIARMGGDEFVIVLPGLGTDAAAERVREFDEVAIAAGEEVCGIRVISLSAGCAFFPVDGQNAEELLAEADRRMYKSKQQRKVARSELSITESLSRMGTSVGTIETEGRHAETPGAPTGGEGNRDLPVSGDRGRPEP